VRVVLAPNAFKGSLDPVEVARAWEAAARAREGSGAQVEVRPFPMSDGGDGFLAALRHHRPAILEVAARARDPLGREIAPLWGWDPEAGVAYVESAAAIGLRLLDRGERDPLRATSAGLGRLIRTAGALAPNQIVVGLGGSATVDGGLGMARELGFRFEDRGGRPLERPLDLPALARIVPPDEPALPAGIRVLALADVEAPLHGPEGAARAFGPQKGADPAAIGRLAEGLERLGEAWRADLGAPEDLPGRMGAGAAGGAAAGLAAFLGAEIAPGAAWLADLAGLAEAIAGAAGVVTGEGRFDAGSLRGKATGHVLALARAAGVPAAVVCGSASCPAPPGVLVVAADAHGEPGPRLDAAGLGRLLAIVLERWAAPGGRGIFAPR
jgi:glycerate kinase